MRTIWTNGCFDVLHRGHIELFEYAKSLGDYLIVGIDTDERVADLKGPSRPFNKLEDRRFMLESIRCIDEVVTFDSEEELITQLMLSKAQTMVVGSDYRDKLVVGSPFVKEVKFFDRIGNYSTTGILEAGCAIK